MSRIEITEITPQMAEQILMRNDVNRPLRKHRVGQYADAIAMGRWGLTGDPIVLDSKGRLIQGQHRLHACIQANRPFRTAVMYDADPAVYAVMDSGLGRTAGDVLAHAGHGNAGLVAAAARIVLGYESKVLQDSHQWARVAHREAIEWEAGESAAAYARAATNGKTTSKATGLSGSALAAFEILLDRRGQAHEEWFGSLKTGANLDVGDPILTLRNYAVGSVGKTAIIHLSALIRAWNASVTSKRLLGIKPWVRGTPFPVIITTL